MAYIADAALMVYIDRVLFVKCESLKRIRCTQFHSSLLIVSVDVRCPRSAHLSGNVTTTRGASDGRTTDDPQIDQPDPPRSSVQR